MEQAHSERATSALISPRQRKIILFCVALAMFILALTFVWNVLNEFTLKQITESVLSVSSSAVGLSVLFMAISYAGISLYDYLALPYAGKHMPLRHTIFASFCAFAISNSLGMTAVTSNAIRYRLYSSWGLGAVEVGIVALITTTFLLLSAMSLIAIGLIIDSAVFQAVFKLPAYLPYVLAVVLGIVVTGGLSLFLKGAGERSIRQFNIKLPQKRHVIFQWIVGLIDWITMAAVLFVLLPQSPEFSFLAFVPIFVAAHYLGAISGLPGGIGVFEAIVLLLVPTSDELAVAAGLIAYRVVYYFLPLILATLMLTAHELIQGKSHLKSKSQQFAEITQTFAPTLFALLSFIAGSVMLISTAIPEFRPNVSFIAGIIPQPIIELSHLFASAIGTLLLLVAMGLQRRLYGAWRLGILLLLAGATFTLIGGGLPLKSILIAGLGACLFISKEAFYRRGRVDQVQLSWSRLGAIFGTLSLALWAGFYAHKNEAYSNTLWWDFTLQADTSQFLRAAAMAGAILLIYFVWRLMNPPRVSSQPESSEDIMNKVRSIIATAENATSEASLALIGDKKFLFSDSGQSFLMYGVKGQNWLTMGEPVGRESERKDLMRKFCEEADRHGAWPSFYGIREDCLADCISLNLAIQKIGEKALVPLEGLSFQGGKRAKIRQTRNRAEKAGCTFEVIYPKAGSEEMDRLQTISDAWLEHHKGREKSFSLGKFDRQLFADSPIAVARADGEIVAFSNLWLTQDKREVSLDLMRYTPDSMTGLMEYLLSEAMLWGSAQGYQYFSLGKAPLAGLDDHKLAPLMSKIGALIYKYGDRIYGFEGLRRFKSKFDPIWEPMYLAAPSQFVMPVAMGNLALLSSGGFRGLFTREA